LNVTAERSDPSEDKARRHRRAAAAAVGACGADGDAVNRAEVEQAAPKMVLVRRAATTAGAI
jgi:hypothetical protein